MPAPRIAAAYIRVSTDDQIEYSPDAQLAEIRKYAASHGFILPNEFIFADEGISGKRTKNRTEFNRMIGTAKQKPKPFEAILLWKFSRFARSRQDSIVYKSMLRRDLGIEVISITEPLADDKMSIIMEAMIEAMDEYYSINLAEEVKRGMTEKARRGGLQSTPPFGYRVEKNVLVPIPEEAELVRSIFSRFIGGQGCYPIARWLNDLGVRTHRGNKFENRTVEYILRNPVYIGKLRWNPTERSRRNFSHPDIILADAKHPPLISEETWDAAQKRIGEIKAAWRYHGRPVTEHKDWVSGLVRCSECGATLIFAKPHYWKCNNYARGHCKYSQHITDEKLKGMILSALEHDAKEGISLHYSTVRSQPQAVDELTVLKEQRKSCSAKLSRLRDAYLSGVETLESYAAAKSALEQHLQSLDDQISRLSSSGSDQAAVTAALKSKISEAITLLRDPSADMPAKHQVAHSLMEKCVYDKASNLLTIHYFSYI